MHEVLSLNFGNKNDAAYNMETLKRDISAIKAVLGDIMSIKQEIQSLAQSVQFMSDKYEEQKDKCEAIEASMRDIIKENTNLKLDIQSLKECVARKDKDDRKYNVVLYCWAAESG